MNREADDDLLDYDEYLNNQQQKQDRITRCHPSRNVRLQLNLAALQKPKNQPITRQSSIPPPNISTSRSTLIDEPAHSFLLMSQVPEGIRKGVSQKLQKMTTNQYDIFEQLAQDHKRNYMVQHKTTIPIGQNCQAQLPTFLGLDYYDQKVFEHCEVLTGLELSKRIENVKEFQERLSIFRLSMGEDRTEQQLVLAIKAYEDCRQDQNFQVFIKSQQIWLNEYLQNACYRRPGRKINKNSKKKPNFK